MTTVRSLTKGRRSYSAGPIDASASTYLTVLEAATNVIDYLTLAVSGPGHYAVQAQADDGTWFDVQAGERATGGPLFYGAFPYDRLRVRARLAPVDLTVDGIGSPADVTLQKVTDEVLLVPGRVNVRAVGSIEDLPPANEQGERVLSIGSSWLITGPIDLGSTRLVMQGPVALVGLSPETCTITGDSQPGEALVSATGTLTIRDLGFIVPADTTGVDVDGTVGGAAIDWTGVNFTGAGRSMKLTNVTNAVLDLMAWLGPDGILVDGSIDTLAVTSSLWAMFIADTAAIEFTAGTSMVNRRIRIESSVMSISNADATGIVVTPTELSLSEAFILNWVNFSGAGTYIDGTLYTDDTARWVDCRGIINTARIGAMYATGNALTTAIASASTYTKANLITTANAENQRFDHANNRLTYTSGFATAFKVDAFISAFAGNNKVIGLKVAKNGVVLPGPAALGTSSGNLIQERAQNISYTNMVTLQLGDYLELFVANLTDTAAVTPVEAALIVSER